MSTTTEPKVGEWWWVEHRFTSRPVPARWMEGGGWHCPSGWIAAEHAMPIARIPDPPAPEPTEAEKIDARRAQVWRDWNASDVERSPERLVRMIRESDEDAGYVLVPTSRNRQADLKAISKWVMAKTVNIRAALSAAKGDA